MEIRINEDNNDLWCCDCKEPIAIGEKYAIVKEQYGDEEIEKTYHMDCCPLTEEE